MTKQKTPTSPRGDGHTPLKFDATDCMEVISNWNFSMLNFYMNRAQAYLSLPGEMPSLLTPNDCVEAQERFLATMVADYATQAERLKQLVPDDAIPHADDGETGYEQGLLKAQADAAKIIDQAKRQAGRIMADAEKRAAALSGAPSMDAGEDASAADGKMALKKSA